MPGSRSQGSTTGAAPVPFALHGILMTFALNLDMAALE